MTKCQPIRGELGPGTKRQIIEIYCRAPGRQLQSSIHSIFSFTALVFSIRARPLTQQYQTLTYYNYIINSIDSDKTVVLLTVCITITINIIALVPVVISTVSANRGQENGERA